MIYGLYNKNNLRLQLFPYHNSWSFATAIQFHPSLIFLGRNRILILEWSPVMGSTLDGSNIRLGWKWMVAMNTVAYYDTATITAIKGFIVMTLGIFYRLV
jgi:hypothetical protein